MWESIIVLHLSQYFFLLLFPICQSVFLFLEPFFLLFFSLERREKREEREREKERQKTRKVKRKYLENRWIFGVLGIAVVLEILQRTDYDLRRRFIFFFPHFYSFSFYSFALLWVGGIEIEESGVEHRKFALRVRPPSSDSGFFFFNFGGARPQYFIYFYFFDSYSYSLLLPFPIFLFSCSELDSIFDLLLFDCSTRIFAGARTGGGKFVVVVVVQWIKTVSQSAGPWWKLVV